MNKYIDTARQRLIDGGYTCVVLIDDFEYTSYDRGVKPLISLLQSNRSVDGAFAADKCVGAGAAHLYVLLGVRAVWANVISASAIDVLKNNNIEIYYDKSVPYIINRKGDGMCPIESAVASTKSSTEAYDLIIAALKQLAEGASVKKA